MVSAFSLQGRVAIVVGAGRSIGRAMAVGLAEAGADVVVAARTATDIESTADEIRGLGRQALSVPTDARLSEQVAEMVKRALGVFDRVDILINNVGGAFPASTLDLSEENWERLIGKNLKTCFLCSKAVAEVMSRREGGSVINIASTEGLLPAPLNAAYGAAKAGLINLTHSLAVEWAPYSIRVNTIVPGFIGSPALPDAMRGYPGLMRAFEGIPLGRAARPEDFVGPAVYLASDASSYVTGAVITVDGGLTSRLG